MPEIYGKGVVSKGTVNLYAQNSLQAVKEKCCQATGCNAQRKRPAAHFFRRPTFCIAYSRICAIMKQKGVKLLGSN